MSLSRRALFGLSLAALAQRPKPRPNVVFVMTDDHSAWATGAYGCKDIHTPNIDALARGGVKFTRAYACTPVCSPSRLTYMSGCVPSVHGVQDWLRPEDAFGPTARPWLEGLTIFPEVLARNGYRCGMVGKWHMGNDEQAQRGFTYWATVPGGGGPYKDVTYVKNGQTVPYKGFKEDAIGDFALEFLREHDGSSPFYLQMPFYAPHTPLDFQPEEDRAPYANSEFSCYPDTPKHANQNPSMGSHHGKRASKLGYSALITAADRNIGRVLKLIEERGWRDNTIVVFTADQGWNAGHHGVWGKGNGTWPFNMYEESIRVPLIWNHPAAIKPAQTITAMVSSYDFFPSLLDYLGLDAPLDPRRVGRSYAPFLRGQKPRWDDKLFFEYSYVRGIRTTTRKLIIRAEGFPSEFYDLEKDPGETVNRIDDPAYGREIAALRAEIGAWFQRAGAPQLEGWRATTKQNLTKYGDFPRRP
jgi:arylsulfatase A-like enzyme